jgi:hypothetical protein
MSNVETLFAKRGSVSCIAREMRTSIGTVWCWKRTGKIPRWHRPAVLAAVQRLGIELTPETITYLASVE